MIPMISSSKAEESPFTIRLSGTEDFSRFGDGLAPVGPRSDGRVAPRVARGFGRVRAAKADQVASQEFIARNANR